MIENLLLLFVANCIGYALVEVKASRHAEEKNKIESENQQYAS